MKTLSPLTILILSAIVWTAAPVCAQECRDWQECRQLALAAVERQDYDAFHDLAWRTLQLGPNDPALMTMLARAQSLSGRTGRCTRHAATARGDGGRDRRRDER